MYYSDAFVSGENQSFAHNSMASQYVSPTSMGQYANGAPMAQYVDMNSMTQFTNLPPNYSTTMALPSQYSGASALPPQFSVATALPPQYSGASALPQFGYESVSPFAQTFSFPTQMEQRSQFLYGADPQYSQQFATPNGLISHLPTTEDFLKGQGIIPHTVENNAYTHMMQQIHKVEQMQKEIDYRKQQQELQIQLNMPSYADLMSNSYNDYLNRQKSYNKQDQRRATPGQYTFMMQQRQMSRGQQNIQRSPGGNGCMMIAPYSPSNKIPSVNFTSGSVSYRY